MIRFGGNQTGIGSRQAGPVPVHRPHPDLRERRQHGPGGKYTGEFGGSFGHSVVLVGPEEEWAIDDLRVSYLLDGEDASISGLHHDLERFPDLNIYRPRPRPTFEVVPSFLPNLPGRKTPHRGKFCHPFRPPFSSMNAPIQWGRFSECWHASEKEGGAVYIREE